MTLSELIATLEHMLQEYGDIEVYSGGEDYPGKVEDVSYQVTGTPYKPSNTAIINARG